MKVRIVGISDTHRAHASLTADLEAIGADLIVHAGDADCVDEKTTFDFLNWLNEISNFSKNGVLFTPGNHDVYFTQCDMAKVFKMLGPKVHLLINEGIKIEGLNFWLSPNSLIGAQNYDAFTCNYEDGLSDVWDKFPTDVDVLVTHTPPNGILDKGYGSTSLRERLKEIKPKLHIFGHIHVGYGSMEVDGITFVNASSTGPYGDLYAPLVITVDEKISVSQPGISF